MAVAYYKNTNSHGVSIPGGPRQPAGAVFATRVAEAQELYAEVEGVESSDKAAYDEYVAGNTVSSEPTGEMLANQAFAKHRAEARMTSIAAPLQRVVGDDEAPLGPPTGEQSTVQAEAEKDLAHSLAFGPNEAKEAVEEPVPPNTWSGAPKTQVVHNEQAAAYEEANRLAQELNDMGQKPPEPEPEPSKSTSKKKSDS